MPQLLGLIFDLDGTLVDSAADLRISVNLLLAQHGRCKVTLDDLKAMIGDGPRVLLQRAFAATGEPLSHDEITPLIRDFIALYQSQPASEDMLYPLAREIISDFRGRQIKIGLCTNKPYVPTLQLLRDIGIGGLFDFVAGSDTFPVFKPDPGHVLGVVKGIGLRPENCVMIGDSGNDIVAARGASVKSIAVSHGYGRDVARLGADAIIGHFEELPIALGKLGFDLGV
jgi:phosphoglycolate phosphatase